MIKQILVIILLINVSNLHSQSIFGEFVFSEGPNYLVSEKLKLNSDSTYSYEWSGDLSEKLSNGTYRVRKDTLYLKSHYNNHIKSINTNLVNENGFVISISNPESLDVLGLYATYYFQDTKSHSVEINYDKAAYNQESDLMKIENNVRKFYSFTDIDSIVLNSIEGKIGTIEKSLIKGNNVVIEILDKDYLNFYYEKCVIKNNRNIFMLYKGKRARLLSK